MPQPTPARRWPITWKRDGSRARAMIAAVGLWCALAAWALASPVGASPDDDFHLVSAWCSFTSSGECVSGSGEESRRAPEALLSAPCFAFDPAQSGACQGESLDDSTTLIDTTRGNFDHTYPPLFYAINGVFASDEIEPAVIAMRLLNVTLFVTLAVAVSINLTASERAAAHLGWLITAVPLGMFFIASNNPSSWAFSGLAIAVPAAWSAWTASGRRLAWLLGGATAASAMAIGARADAATYAVLALVAIAALRWRSTSRRAPHLTLIAVASLAGLFAVVSTDQAQVASTGLGDPTGRGGISLLGYNLLHLPDLVFGGFGATGLGWLDTAMPGLVTWPAAAAFIGIAFTALERMRRVQLAVVTAVCAATVALPLTVLQASGDVVGANVQARYIWPLVIVLAQLMLLRNDDTLPGFTTTGVRVAGTLVAGANSVALYTTMRRFITGVDGRSASLNDGAEWWWAGLPQPMTWWLLGSVAFATFAAVTVHECRLLAARSPRDRRPIVDDETEARSGA